MSTSTRSETGWRLLPAPADLLFILFLAALPLARGWQAINTDGDLGRHLRVGRDILADGLFFTDRYSWTMQGQPFVPYEWLSEVLFALSHRWAEFNGVLLLCGLVVATTVWFLTLWFRRMGVDPLLAFLASTAAGLAGSFHWLARPHLWSLLGTVAVLFVALSADDARSSEPRAWRRNPWTAALFAVWANLHGGFLFGLVLLALLAVGEMLDWLAGGAKGTPERLYRLLSLLGAGIVGACINPVGARIFPHVIDYFGNSWLMAMTMEYRSPNFHLWWGKVFLVLLAASIAAVALSRRPAPLRVLVPFLATTAFALHSARNIPLWALSGLPLLVWHLDADWKGLGVRVLWRVRQSFELAAQSSRPGLWALGGVAVSVLLALRLPPHPGFDPAVFPVEAVARARAKGVTGRLFNELAWGGYILYAWPEQKVFIDAQTDFYGEELAQDYLAIRNVEPGWELKLAKWGSPRVMLPYEAPLAQLMKGLEPHPLPTNIKAPPSRLPATP